MKLLIVLRDPKRGGTSVEEIFKGMINQLKKEIDVELYWYRDDCSVLWNLIKIYRASPAIVHITSDMYWLSLLLPCKKMILTIHDVGRYSSLKGIKKLLYHQLYLFWPSLRANAITTVSEFTKGELKKLVSKSVFKKITVIHNPIPLLFENRPVLPIGQEGTVLQIGTGFHKNLETVILAMTGTEYTLNIVGFLTSDQISLLEKCEVKYNSFMNLSYEEVYDCYINSDIVIFISQYEGFGMPVLEAQTCGRPVIVSRLASLPEVAGLGAHYIEQYDDTTEVSEAIKKVMQDDVYRKELVEKGRANVQRFSRGKIIRSYLDLYKTIA